MHHRHQFERTHSSSGVRGIKHRMHHMVIGMGAMRDSTVLNDLAGKFANHIANLGVKSLIGSYSEKPKMISHESGSSMRPEFATVGKGMGGDYKAKREIKRGVGMDDWTHDTSYETKKLIGMKGKSKPWM